MTDEQLEKLLKDTTSEIDCLPKSEEALPKEEKRRRQVLLLKKWTLTNIKIAKENHRQQDELVNAAIYGFLSSWGARHPFFVRILLNKFRWSAF